MPPTLTEEQRANPQETLSQVRSRALELQRAEPTVAASELADPTTAPEIPAPRVGNIPSRIGATANAVMNESEQNFIAPQTEEARRLKELRDEQAALSGGGSLSDLFQTQREEFGIPENIRELKDINLQLADMQTGSELTKTRIEGAAGQTLGQAQRELTQEDREAAVRQAGLAARAAVLQGNIETARQAALDAVNIEYQDRQLERQNLIDQINSIQPKVDEQMAQLLEQEKRQYEAELAATEELKSTIAEAMVSGASQQEIAQLTSEQVDDQTKLQLARTITARGATEMRDLEMQQARASINASNATAAQRWYDLEVAREAEAARAAAVQAGVLGPEQAETVDEIDKQFRSEPVVKEYNEAVAKRYAVEEVLNNGVNGVQDLLLVYEFMKAVDPTSVVRESEFDNAAKSGNIFKGQFAKFNQGYFGEGGQLPADVKDTFTNSLNAAYRGKQQQYYNVKEQFGQKVNRRLGIDGGSQYLTSYETGAPADTAATANPEEADTGDIVEYGDENNKVRYIKNKDGSFTEI